MNLLFVSFLWLFSWSLYITISLRCIQILEHAYIEVCMLCMCMDIIACDTLCTWMTAAIVVLSQVYRQIYKQIIEEESSMFRVIQCNSAVYFKC